MSSDYDSTHEANHSDSSDVAQTEDTEKGKNPSQNVILHALIPPEVSQSTHVQNHLFNVRIGCRTMRKRSGKKKEPAHPYKNGS